MLVGDCVDKRKVREYIRESGQIENNVISQSRSTTYLAEPGPLLPEQGSICDTSGVHTAEGNTRAIVISSVQL